MSYGDAVLRQQGTFKLVGNGDGFVRGWGTPMDCYWGGGLRVYFDWVRWLLPAGVGGRVYIHSDKLMMGILGRGRTVVWPWVCNFPH